MATEVKAAPLPNAPESTDPGYAIWQAFGDNGTPFSLVGIHAEAQAKLAEMGEVRQAKAVAKASARSEDTEEGRALVALETLAEAAVKKIRTEFQPQIDALIQQRDAKEKLVKERVKEAETKAIEVKLGSVLAALDPEEKVREYKAIVDKFNSLKKMLSDNGLETVKGYRLPGPGVATGASGQGSGNNGDSHPMGRPRFDFASVDGVEIDEPTNQSIAEAAGANSADHFKTVLLTALGGNKESLPRFPDTIDFQFNGHQVVVGGRTLSVKEAETAPVQETVSV